MPEPFRSQKGLDNNEDSASTGHPLEWRQHIQHMQNYNDKGRTIMKKRIIGIIAAAAIATGILAGCGSSTSTSTASSAGTTESADGKELVTIRDAVMTAELDQYATEIGLWQGIFEEHGIDLQTTEFVAGVNTIDAVVNGMADIGMMADYATVNRLGNTLENTNLKIFSPISAGRVAKAGGLYVAPQYADDLSSLDGSEGFMYQEGTVYYYDVCKAIDYIGLEEADQKLINTDSAQTRLALIQKGDASAVYAGGSEGLYIEEEGWVLAAQASDIGIKLGTYFLATDEYINENKEILAEYLKAVYESVQYIDAHLDECAEYLEGKLGKRAEDFKADWLNYTFDPGFSEEAAAHLDEMEQWAYEHGSFDTDYNIRDFIDTQVVEIAFPDDVTIVK